MSFDLSRTQNPFGGGGFLADPFLELASGVTTPAIPKSNKFDPCVSNGALAGSIIGTLIMCTFIGFLTWLIYLRPKLRELRYMHLYESRRIANRQHLHSIPSSSNSNHKQQSKRQYDDDDDEDNSAVQLPIDVTDCKFGTFPFRQSQTTSVNGHYNRVDWLNRISCSFRSVNLEKDSEMLDIPLLDPTFSGLNFSITGNMRAGIFVKEIIDKGAPPQGIIKPKSPDQLKTGDRIMALTVCFESIVYEDALTILSYASPYPVILRVQRPSHHTKVNETSEKRPPTVNTTNKVKWQDDFEHYDNDTSQQSIVQTNPPVSVNNLPPIPTNSKVPPSPKKHSPSKKTRHNNNAATTTQSRVNSRASSANKGNKIKASSNSAIATSGTTTKRSNSDAKKHRPKANTTNSNNNNNSQRSIANQMMLMSTGLTAKPAANTKAPPIPTSAKPIKSGTDSVMSYRHYNKSGDGEGVAHSKDKPNKSEASTIPYYDSPYDYYYGNVSQYQYLHQSHLNKNNNNSYSTESLTAITPNLAASVYTIKLSSTKSCVGIRRRRERRLSSPAVLTTAVLNNHTAIDIDEKLDSVDNSDSFV
ncbi:unnamed protein product [Rotaria magnacalcarata]|uniref:PDZ domain-containing protein n=4 Tax=Rotaria magnacalcarata TaxID=392030 RepID=A0A819BCW2_9BILA|nr:unnamed protein product [Rotaria magnacalcarata]CAF3790181.1 unnamed protein product [Rotaria magnacalcarata]